MENENDQCHPQGPQDCNRSWNWNDPSYFSLENAIITPESARTKESLDKIKYIASRVLKN